jgi:2-polyprenyl-6-methoxyphenol hydroxylase-like FAD-dependent oxidoreductase
MSKHQILVVGGGIAGMSAALALARGGRRVHLLEKAAEFTEIGAGLQLAPNALRVLERLGILAEIKKCAVFPPNFVLLDINTGTPLQVVTLGESFEKAFSFPYIVMHRSDLLSILYEACRDTGMITFENNKEVCDIEETSPVAKVICRDGTVYEADAVIAADGLWSTIRRKLFDSAAPHWSGYVAYRGTVPIGEVTQVAGEGNLLIWMGAGIHLVQYPVRGGQLYNQVAVFKCDETSTPEMEGPRVGEELDERFAGTCTPVREAVKRVGHEKRWPIQDRAPLITWTRNRFVLVGDAAHPMLQFMAQGACQSLEDAACLADTIGLHGNDFERAFLSFQNARFPRTAQVQTLSRYLDHFWHSSGPAAEMRNAYLQRQASDDYSPAEWLYNSQQFHC